MCKHVVRAVSSLDLLYRCVRTRGALRSVGPGGLTCDWWAAVNFHFRFRAQVQPSGDDEQRGK